MAEKSGGAPLYDVLIIGTGVAGLSAGMYASRFDLKTLMIGEQPGGLITTTDLVENYPGIKSISGPDMGTAFFEHALQFGAEFENARVVEVKRCDSSAVAGGGKKAAFSVKTAKKEFFGKTVIIATGTVHRKLGVPGEEEYANKGVSYCALCDAAFFKGKAVSVVGGGDSAAKEAILLSKVCKEVHVFVRKDVMRAEPINMDTINRSANIKMHYQTEVTEILGNEKVTGVRTKAGEEIALDAVFMAIGHLPMNELAKQAGCELDSHGYVKVNVNSETSVPGVYACGDLTDKPFKQAIIGAAEAVMATYFAYQYIQKNEIENFCA